MLFLHPFFGINQHQDLLEQNEPEVIMLAARFDNILATICCNDMKWPLIPLDTVNLNKLSKVFEY